MNKALLTLLSAAALVGCSKGDEATTNSTAVEFSAGGISTRIDTSANEWIAGDRIGIISDGFSSEYSNVQYTATESGETTGFSPVTEEILIPNGITTSTSVRFYAYYPYHEDSYIADDKITIDISAQAKDGLAMVDFMTAFNSAGVVSSSPANIDLFFSHRLSQVVMNITCNDTVTSLDGLTAMLNISSEANYYLTGMDAGAINKSSLTGRTEVPLIVTPTEGDTTKATITAILHPATYTAEDTLYFTLGEDTYEVAFATTLTSGLSHTFNISLGYELAGFDDGSTIGNWATGSTGSVYPEAD